MDWFERYPVLLVLVIVLTVEAWAAVKVAVLHAWAARAPEPVRRAGDRGERGRP